MENVMYFQNFGQVFNRFHHVMFALFRMVENLESKADIFEECMSTESRSPKDILFDLRGIGFYGFMCNMENGGSGLTYTETLKLQVIF